MECDAHTCQRDSEISPTEFFYKNGFVRESSLIFRGFFCPQHNAEIRHASLQGEKEGCRQAQLLVAKTERGQRAVQIMHTLEDFRPLILVAFGVLFYLALTLFWK